MNTKLFFKKALIFCSLSFFIFGLAFSSVSAQAIDENTLWGDSGVKGDVQGNVGLADKDPRVIAAQIIRVFLGFLGIIALIIILYAGFKWMTAMGNSDNVDSAKTMLTQAAIGFLIILSAYGLTSFLMDNLVAATQTQ